MAYANPHRLSYKEVSTFMGIANVNDLLIEYMNEDVVPACCKEGCVVEPDGHCEHGCPSILINAGLI